MGLITLVYCLESGDFLEIAKKVLAIFATFESMQQLLTVGVAIIITSDCPCLSI
jgi:hypothetical protein